MNSIWSYSPETVKLGCDLCDLDLWPWPFAWTSLPSLVITPENFMMIRWWEHSQKGVTDGRTDRRTDWTIHRAAWSQLKRDYWNHYGYKQDCKACGLHRSQWTCLEHSTVKCEFAFILSFTNLNIFVFQSFVIWVQWKTMNSNISMKENPANHVG